MKSMLTQLGIVVPENVNPQPKNVGGVFVHARLPAFAKAGQTVDVTVSSIGNATSLRGRSLLMDQQLALDLSAQNGIGLAAVTERQMSAARRYASDAQANAVDGN